MKFTHHSGSTGGRGFSLFEMLVVVAILGVLVVLLFPVFSMFMARLNTTKCANNLRQQHAATMAYALDHDGWLPICTDQGNPEGNQFYHNISSYLLGKTIFSPDHVTNYPIFFCPERPRAVIQRMVAEGKASSVGYGSYAQNENVLGIPPNSRPRRKLALFDKPASVWMIADANGYGAIYNPTSAFPGRAAFSHNHKMQAVMLDGHIEQFTEQQVAGNENDIFGVNYRTR